jgi:hypothetical protein
VIDIDYAGDSSKFQHLIDKREEVGFPNKSMLNFEMNLRNYKNVTDYNAYKPFLFPAIRDFSPKKQWAEKKKDVQMLNPDFKK